MWLTIHDTAFCSYKVHVCMCISIHMQYSNTYTPVSLMLDPLAKIWVHCVFQSNHVKYIKFD